MDQQISRPVRRRGMSDRQVSALRKKGARYTTPDPELRGHYIRVMPQGANVFAAVARNPYGKQIWHTIGNADVMTIEEARDRARTAIKRIKAGLAPVEPSPVQPKSFQAVAEDWVKRHVEKKKLRSRDEIVRVLRTYVFPTWGDRPFVEISRSDTTQLLDHIEDKHGARTADVVLAYARAIMNWYARRVDSYRSPIVSGMGRNEADARARVLDDGELRELWRVTADDQFGGVVRLLLLTAQRLNKVLSMRWDDIGPAGVWTIRTAAREKGNAGELRLPKLALDVVRAQPHMASNPHIFAGRGIGHINNMAGDKAALDARLKFAQRWTLHDLRRTARSLMSRAGVSSEHAERVLGHTIEGVEGVYDRHSYRDEKADALQRLANLIEIIVNPPADNVRQFKRR